MQILMGASYFVLLAAAWNTRQCGNKCVPMFRGQAGRLCGIRADIVRQHRFIFAVVVGQIDIENQGMLVTETYMGPH